MADSSGEVPPLSSPRRKSFVEMLNPRAFGNTTSLSASPSSPIPATPAVPAQRKSSMSIALGLSGAGSAASQESPYNAFARQRRASISTSNGSPEFRNSFDENAIIEDDNKVGPTNSPPSPSFARRLSFGAQALRDVRQGGTSPSNSAGRRPSSSLFTLSEDANTTHTLHEQAVRSQGTAKTGGEGFNWSDAMRDRNRRASFTTNSLSASGHNRSKSFNAPPTEAPKEIALPAPPPAPAPLRSRKPDHLGERMLRGDFMMD